MPKKNSIKTDAIVERNEVELVGISSSISTIPDYLREAPTEPIRGAENVESADIIMPALKICGKQSPQFDENNDKHIEGIEQGQLFNTISREVYGSTIHIVPIYEIKTRRKLRPFGEDGGPYCQSFDGKHGVGDPGGVCRNCKERLFGKKSDGSVARPSCTEYFNFVFLVMPEGEMPKDQIWKVLPRPETVSVFDFKSTSFSAGQQFLSMLKMRNRDWCSTVFKMTTSPMSKGKNSWHVPVMDNAGWLSEQGYKLCKPLYEEIKLVFESGRATVDEDGTVDAEHEDA